MSYQIFYSKRKPAWRDTPDYPHKDVFDAIDFGWEEINNLNPNYVDELTVSLVIPKLNKEKPSYIKIFDKETKKNTYWFFEKITKRQASCNVCTFKLDVWATWIVGPFCSHLMYNYIPLERLYKTFKLKQYEKENRYYFEHLNGSVELVKTDYMENNQFLKETKAERLPKPTNTLALGDFQAMEMNTNEFVVNGYFDTYFVFDDAKNTTSFSSFPLVEDPISQSGMGIIPTQHNGQTIKNFNDRAHLTHKVETNANRFLGVYRWLSFINVWNGFKVNDTVFDFKTEINFKKELDIQGSPPNTNAYELITMLANKSGLRLFRKDRITPGVVFAKTFDPKYGKDNISHYAKTIFLGVQEVSYLELILYSWLSTFNNGFSFTGVIPHTTFTKRVSFGGEQWSSTDKFRKYLESNKETLTFSVINNTFSSLFGLVGGILDKDANKAISSTLGFASPFVSLAQAKRTAGYDTTFVGDNDIQANSITWADIGQKRYTKGGHDYYSFGDNKDLAGFIWNEFAITKPTAEYVNYINQQYCFNGVEGVGNYKIADLIQDNPTVLVKINPNYVKQTFTAGELFGGLDRTIQNAVFKILTEKMWFWTQNTPNSLQRYEYKIMEIV